MLSLAHIFAVSDSCTSLKDSYIEGSCCESSMIEQSPYLCDTENYIYYQALKSGRNPIHFYNTFTILLGS